MKAISIDLLDHNDRSIAERIHAIQMGAYAQEARLLGAVVFPPLQRSVSDVEQSTDHFFGAYLELILVGVVSVSVGKVASESSITSLVVSPEFQRRGIGGALLAAVISEFKDQTLTVSTGALNQPALELYAKFGFTETRRRVLGKEAIPVVELRR